jgi:hypothetical protein
MTDELDPTKRRDPFDDPVTGDQSLPEQPPGRVPGADVAASQVANAGTTTGLPGELFAKPDPDQPETPPEEGEPRQ